MRIGCLQFAPQVGDIDNNLNRADAVLNKSPDLEDLDLLVLPELAFTGYNFHSLAQIAPFLEPSGSGISSLWARTTALKLNCNVVVGYPEKVDVANKWPTSPEFYNSAIMVNRDGETIANYRKSFLYAVDETWALEGRDGFFEDEIPDLGSVAMGICMDVNPYKFEAPWHAFEFAFHVLEVQANLVILTMAWVTRENPRSFTQLPQEPDLDTLKYWIQRLEPIIRSDNEEEIIFVVANRTGIEEDCVYTGTSTVFGVRKEEVNLYGVLGRGVKEVLVVDTSRKPFAKVVKDDSGEEVDTGNTYRQPQYQAPAQTPDQPSTPASSTPVGPSLREIEESRQARGIASPSPALVTSPKSAPPKLELMIPTDNRVLTGVPNGRRPHSGALSPGTMEVDIPTPTAPSPTPISLRPRFPFSDIRSTLPPMEATIPFSASWINGGGLIKAAGKRMDSPITPPIRNAKELDYLLSAISETASPVPTDGEVNSEKRRRVDTMQNSPAQTNTAFPERLTPPSVQDRGRCPTTQQAKTHGDVANDNNSSAPPDVEKNGLSEADDRGEPQDGNQEPHPPSNIPARPQSTKSRNASLSRADGATPVNGISRNSSQSRMSIPLLASPSVFYREPHIGLWQSESPMHTPSGGMTKGSQPARQENAKEMVEIKHSTILRNAFTGMGTGASEFESKESSGRPVSRGRQPSAKANATNATNGGVVPLASASTSRAATGSTDRSRQSSNNRSIMSRGTTSTASSASWLFGTPPLRTQPGLDPDDEIVAMINLISRSCPVHSHSQTQQGQARQPADATGVTPSDVGGQSPQTPVSGRVEDSIYEVILPPNIRELVNSLPSSEARNPTPLRGLDIARSRGSPKFDPPTPTAMVYDASLQDETNIPRVASVETKQEC